MPPGSPAAGAQLAVGPRIATIDGDPVPAEGWREALLAHTRVDAGTTVVLGTADGRELRLVAADYY